jgi:hypothetical protein
MADYFVKSGTGGTDNGSSWANAAESIVGLLAAQALSPGDRVLIHNTHSATYGGSTVLDLSDGNGVSAPIYYLCVDGGDATGASLVGTTVGALTTGAIEVTSGNFGFGVLGFAYVQGIAFRPGAGASSSGASISFGNSTTVQSRLVFESCDFWLNTTNAAPNFIIGPSSTTGAQSTVEYYNCTFRFGATTQAIEPRLANIKFYNCSVNGSGSTPAHLFEHNLVGNVECAGCDWTTATALINLASTNGAYRYLFNNCRVGTLFTGTHPGPGSMSAEFMACSNTDSNLVYHRRDGHGAAYTTTSVYLTSGGASQKETDGTATSYSIALDTTDSVASPNRAIPLYTPWIYVLNTLTGSRAVSIKAAADTTVTLKDIDLFLQVEYMGDAAAANTPQSQIATSAPMTGTALDMVHAGNNLSDTGDGWTGIVDTNEKNYTLSKTVTIDEQGYLRVRVGYTKTTASAPTIVYVDPVVTVA